jgi:hypothetical protein
MRTPMIGMVALVLIAAVRATIGVSPAASAQDRPIHPLVTQAEYDRWRAELSNWGRWGKDDEMGTLNLITPAKRKAATALVK